MANASDKKQVKVCVGIDDAGRKVMEEHPPLNIDPPKVLLQRLTGRDHTRPKETDPIIGKKMYPAIPGRQPDPVYHEMLVAYRTSRGDPEAELVLSEKFVRDNLCGCMSQRESAKCADKKLFAFKEAMETYHKLSGTRHGGGDGTDCSCCGGARAKITAFCRGGVDAAVDAVVCTRARIPELDMPKLDPKTSMPTGETDKCDLPSFDCCGGTCSDPDCGWNGIFVGLPEHEVVIGGGTASRAVTIRGCNRDFGDERVTWNSWQKIANEPVAELDPADPLYDPTKKATFSTYWHPTSGTMSEFMVYFDDVFVEYLAHHVWRKWHRLHQKRTIWKLILEPAMLRHLGKDVPEWQQGWCMSHTDFAATISIKRSAEATGEFAERTQCCTFVITGDAAVVATASLDQLSRQRQGLTKSGITEFMAATTVCAFAMGQAKNNLQYYATVMPQIWHVLLTGEAPVGSKLEFFNDGVRLKNSARDDPLGHDLREFNPDVDTATPILRGGFDADALTGLIGRLEQLAKGTVDGEYNCAESTAVRAKLVEFRDGCTDQFQCLHSFLYYQLFEWLTGIEYVNVCCQAEDGKGSADGASRVVRGAANEAVKAGDVPTSGSRGLLLLCAAKRKTPSRSAASKMGLHTHTNYLYVYLPDNAMNDWTAKEGFVGSRAAHTFQAMAGVRSAPAADAWVEYKNRPCGCDPCLARNWDQCLIKSRFFPNQPGKVQIERRSGEASLRAKKTRDSKNFRDLLKEGTVVIARVHPDEPAAVALDDDDGDDENPAPVRDSDGEPYYVGVVGRRDPSEQLVWQNTKTQVLGTNVVKSGTYVVRFHWLHHRPHLRQHQHPNSGDRGYQLVPGESTAIFPTNTMISNLAVHAAAQRMDRTSDPSTMWLSKKDHEAIMSHPMELLA